MNFDKDLDAKLLPEENEGTAEPEQKQYVTNRVKAVIAMNLYAVFSVAFVISCKKTVNEKKVGAFDLIMLVNCFTLVVASVAIPLT